jgi:serine/threonine protein kinase
VFSYGVLFNATISHEKPYQELNCPNAYALMNKVVEGARPVLAAGLADNWRDFISKCWGDNPKQRPTFDAIVQLMSTPEFIGSGVDLGRFLKYQKKIVPAEFRCRHAFSRPRAHSGASIQIPGLTDIGFIGRGSFGDVYSARDAQGSIVAVKILREVNARNEELFERESKALASINHPTLLGFYKYLRVDLPDGQHPALLIEYITGGCLQDLIDHESKGKRQPKWDDTQKYIVLYGIAVGMMKLHQNGIMHRDLKPENVLLTDKREPKICDFGLAKFGDSDGSISQTGDTGTPLYMAPEIIRGEERIRFLVDVFSYGVLFNATIAGKIPYAELKIPNPFQLMKRVDAGGRPVLASELDQWQPFVQKCWDNNPLERPSFEGIVQLMSHKSFFGHRVDVPRFLEYQKTVVPPELYCDRVLSADFVNYLKDLSKVSLFYVLTHPNLSAALHDEPDAFIDYLSHQLFNLFDWALSETMNSELMRSGPTDVREKLSKFRLFQVNRTAAAILSDPSPRLEDLMIGAMNDEDASGLPLCERFFAFLDSPSSHNPMFVGHFQRILDWLLRYAANDARWFNPRIFSLLVRFCVDNGDILACQQILTDILAGDWVLGLGHRFFDVLQVILLGTLQCVLAVRGATRPSKSFECHRALPDRPLLPPLNWRHEPISPPVWIEGGRMWPGELTQHVAARLSVFGLTSESAVVDVLDAQDKAYLLLSSISRLIQDDNTRLGFLGAWHRDQDRKLKLIELLLLCGILADPISMVSVQAFRILKAVLSGTTAGDFEASWTNETIVTLVDSYAEDFEFSPHLTPQMVAAFPFFWHHQYKDLAIGDRPFPELEIQLRTGSRFIHSRDMAMTPLERFGWCLIEEPARSDALNHHIMQIIRAWHSHANVVRESVSNPSNNWEREVVTRNLVFLDFLRARTAHDDDGHMDIIQKTEKTFPVFPTYQRPDGSPPFPPTLNGHIFKFWNFVLRSDFSEFHTEYAPLQPFVPAWSGRMSPVIRRRHLFDTFKAEAREERPMPLIQLELRSQPSDTGQTDDRIVYDD